MDSSTIRPVQSSNQPAQNIPQHAVNQRPANNPQSYQQQSQPLQQNSQSNILKQQQQQPQQQFQPASQQSRNPVQPQIPSSYQIPPQGIRPPPQQQQNVTHQYQQQQASQQRLQQQPIQQQQQQFQQRPTQGPPIITGQVRPQNPPPSQQFQQNPNIQKTPGLVQNPGVGQQIRPNTVQNPNPQIRPQQARQGVPPQGQGPNSIQNQGKPPVQNPVPQIRPQQQQQQRPLPPSSNLSAQSGNLNNQNQVKHQPAPTIRTSNQNQPISSNMSSDVLRGRTFTSSPNQQGDLMSQDDDDDVVVGRAVTPQSSANSQNRTPSSSISRTPEPVYNKTPSNSASPEGVMTSQSSVNRGPVSRNNNDEIERKNSVQSIPSRPPSALESANSQSPEPRYTVRQQGSVDQNAGYQRQNSREQNLVNLRDGNYESEIDENRRRVSLGKKSPSEEEQLPAQLVQKPPRSPQPQQVAPQMPFQSQAQSHPQSQSHSQMQHEQQRAPPMQSKPPQHPSTHEKIETRQQQSIDHDQPKDRQQSQSISRRSSTSERRKSVERKTPVDEHVSFEIPIEKPEKKIERTKSKQEHELKSHVEHEKILEPRKSSGENSRPTSLQTTKSEPPSKKKDKVKSPKFAKGDNDSGVDESTQEKDRNGPQSPGSPLKSPTKIPSYSKSRPESITPKSRSRSTSKQRLSLKTTPDTPEPEPLIKKIPMNKIQVGATPSPNLKEVRSKIGSLENATHKPGGGNVKIESKKLDIKAAPRITARNEAYIPKGGDKKIISTKLQWNAKSKIGSLDNVEHKPGGGDKKIMEVKTDFKDKAKPKVGSKDNITYKPGGGEVKDSSDGKPKSGGIVNQKLEVHAEPKIGSLDNIKHKPKGGDKKIFDDKEYLKQIDHPIQPTTPSQSPLPSGASTDNFADDISSQQ